MKAQLGNKEMQFGWMVMAGGLLMAGCTGQQAVRDEAAIAEIQQVQEALVVLSISALGADGAVVQVTYNGAVPLHKLILVLSTETVKVTGDVGAVKAGETLDVVFEAKGSGIRAGGHVKLGIVEVK